MSRAPRAALLTGERGAGKSTLCLSLAAEQGGRFSGIVEIPILDAQGGRIGIRARSLSDGQEWELARADSHLDGPATPRFSFAAEAIERCLRVLMESLSRPDGVTIIDEVGPLELSAAGGFAPILPRLAAAGDLLIVVRPSLLSLLAPRVPRHVVEVVEVTPENRPAALHRLRSVFP